MNLHQVEQAVLAAVFLDKGVAAAVRAELSADKFLYGPANKLSDVHSLVYQSMMQVEGRIDVMSVSKALGSDLERAGGEAYLQYLSTVCLPQLGIHSTEGLANWVTLVDTAGRLKQLGELVDIYHQLFSDFEALVSKVEDVDQFIADFQTKINAIALGTHSGGYIHISEATNSYRRILEDEAAGAVLTYFPMGWPAFERYAIPPQASLMAISGMSSMGKSQLMLQMALGVAIQLKVDDVPGCVIINSYEMVGWRCARRLAACLAGVDYQGMAIKNEQSEAYKSAHKALDLVDSLPIFYSDADMTSAQISLHCARIITTEGPIKMLGVDYAEQVPDPNLGSEELRISNIFNNGQRLARSTGMCTCILSQVSDISMFPDGIVPCNRLRYSRAATNACDVIGYIYNPPQMRAMRIKFSFPEELGDENMAYFLVQKNRDGRLGAIPLEWTSSITRFKDLSLVGFGDSPLYRNLNKLGFMEPMDDF